MNWIDANERLPENGGEYLCTCRFNTQKDFHVAVLDYGTVSEYCKGQPNTFYDKAFGELWDDGIDNIYEVIAWAELPEPYKP